jgi:hypothetical protein
VAPHTIEAEGALPGAIAAQVATTEAKAESCGFEWNTSRAATTLQYPRDAYELLKFR